MLRNFLLAMLAPVLAASAQAADDECLFDQAHQLQKLQAIAARKPRSSVDARERLVTWSAQDGTRWSVVYGGCSHLGFAVTTSKTKPSASSQANVFQNALRMAAEFWHPSDAEDLRKALNSGRFETYTDDALRIFRIDLERFDELTVTHEFDGGTERITVQWVRSG